MTSKLGHMKRSTLARSLAACFVLVLPLAAEAQETGAENQPLSGEANLSATGPAEKCLGDMRAFHSQMQTDGYWLGGYGTGNPGLGYGYGYGYPLGGYGYEYGLGSYPAETGTGYINARPGYEVRLLLAAADTLARNGQVQPCEAVLAAARDQYQQYVADMESAGMPMADVPGWQQRQIAAAQPVSGTTTAIRSDQLLGIDVRNPQNEAIGSVDDVVMSPQTGDIAYLLIARGGWIFGIGEQYVPVPWGAFEVTPNVTLLVLDATTSTMDGAPQVNRDDSTSLGQESQTVDTYWNALKSGGGNN